MSKVKSIMARPFTTAVVAVEPRRRADPLSASLAVLFQRNIIGQRIAWAARAFEKQRTKQRHKWAVVFMNEESLVIALHGSLTMAEKALAQTPAGVAQVHGSHRKMFHNAPVLLRKIKSITGMNVRGITVEIEPKNGHVVQLFTTDTVGNECRPVPKKPAKVRNAATT